MARLPRFVIPGQPQHIIQRGNNRQVILAGPSGHPGTTTASPLNASSTRKFCPTLLEPPVFSMLSA